MGLITQANSIIRGYSRSSAHRGLTTGNVYAHPCTAESKKRQIPLQSNHSSSFTTDNQLRNNVSLPSKRSANQKQQNIEYVPIQTVSYASQRNKLKNLKTSQIHEIAKDAATSLNSALNNDPLMPGMGGQVGKLSVLNQGLLKEANDGDNEANVGQREGHFQFNEMQAKERFLNNFEHEKDNRNNAMAWPFNSLSCSNYQNNKAAITQAAHQQSGMCQKSKSNINLAAKNHSTFTSNGRKMENKEIGDINLGVYSKNHFKHFSKKRPSQSKAQKDNEISPTNTRFALNGHLTNINVSIDDSSSALINPNLPVLASSQMTQDIINQRKRSLASRGKQMQMFSNIHNSQSNLDIQVNQNFQSQNSFIEMVKSSKLVPQKDPKSTIPSYMNVGCSLVIPPPSSLGLTTQNSTDKYQHNRNLMQQHKDRKSEFNKQMEAKRLGSHVHSTIPQKLQNKEEHESIHSHVLMGSGSQFQLPQQSLNQSISGAEHFYGILPPTHILNKIHVTGSQLNDIRQKHSPDIFRGQMQQAVVEGMDTSKWVRMNGISASTDHNSQSQHTKNQNNITFRPNDVGQKPATVNRSPEFSGIMGKQIANQQPIALPYGKPEKNFEMMKHSDSQATSPNKISPNKSVNGRIHRKLDGSRTHKMFDYMFIQMSNEQFKNEYDNKKVVIQRTLSFDADDERRKSKFQSPMKSPDKTASKNFNMQSPQQNLNGLVKIKAYESQITDEIPALQCNLLPTQLDHVKLLICEQEDRFHPKLTPEAILKFEIEKQNQIKQYMEDIIIKLQQKDRNFKVTNKKKFVDDALLHSTSNRIASVYVIVVNRERANDPMSIERKFKSQKRTSDKHHVIESSEDEDEKKAPLDGKDDKTKLRSVNQSINGKHKSLYDSDNGTIATDNLNSTSASSNIPQFKKPLQDRKGKNDESTTKKSKNLSGQAFKRQFKDEYTYKYHPPVKEYPSKYKPTKIKIIQDVTVHDHHKKHPLNIFFNQYNEFIRLIFKNYKGSANPKTSGYLVGLAKALGMNLKKDAFSEQNLKSREHLHQLKEKLIYCFWKKLNDENRDLNPGIEKLHNLNENSDKDQEVDGLSIDSGVSMNNSATPKSKTLGIGKDEEKAVEVQIPNPKPPSTSIVYPQNNTVYKYFIGRGNNSMMVRSLFKNRFWWVQHEYQEMERLNFCWTQVKIQKVMDVLSCKWPNKRSCGNKNLLATPNCKSNKKKRPTQMTDAKAIVQKPVLEPRINENKVYNKIEDNFHMNNKKALYLNMKNYYEALDQDVFDNLPLTFHVKNGLDDPEFHRFKAYYQKCEEEIKQKKQAQKQKRKDDRDKVKEKEETPGSSPLKRAKEDEPSYYQSSMPMKNIWIIKPGENTNRGQGIQVAREFNEIRDIIEDSTVNRRRTCIVQKYIHNPLLINRRKFDIRTYALITSHSGNLKAYLYEEGYLRTSSREYSINNLGNKLVHLTNDAVQKRSEDYGKFEPGNKLSFNEFQMFIDKNYPDLNICFERDILPQMNKMTVDIFRACHGKLDPKRRLHCMEVFGLDFMIDDEFKIYLIEVNTNPCLELSCPLLARLIPNMLENAFKIGLDSIFLPPENFSSKKAFIGDACPENRFSLCYDDRIDGPVLDKLFKSKENVIVEMDEDEFSDDEDVHDDEE